MVCLPTYEVMSRGRDMGAARVLTLLLWSLARDLVSSQQAALTRL